MSNDYNPYPDGNKKDTIKDGPNYPKNKNLIPHTDTTQLQVKETYKFTHWLENTQDTCPKCGKSTAKSGLLSFGSCNSCR